MKKLLALFLLLPAIAFGQHANAQKPPINGVAGPTTPPQFNSVMTAPVIGTTGGTGVNNSTNTLTFPLGNHTAAAIDVANAFTHPNAFNGGSAGVIGGDNSGGCIVCAFFPNGDTSAAPAATFGTALGHISGYVDGSLYYNGQAVNWINLAQTNVRTSSTTGALFNVVAGYPGYLVRGNNALRTQNFDISGDFRTDSVLAEYVDSANTYMFTANTVNNSQTVTSLGFNPVAFGLIQRAINYGSVSVRIHSNSGVGLSATAKISSITASTIVMDQAASGIGGGGTLTGANFSLIIVAPAANYDGVHTFWSYYYQPLTGNITNGSATISSLGFDPTKLGTPPYSTANGAGIPTDSRVVNFTDASMVLGDATTGNATTCTPGSGITITVNTTTESYSGTGTIDASCNVTSFSANPIARALPSNSTASYDKPQTGGTPGLFTSSSVVTGVSSSSITFSTQAGLTLTGVGLKVSQAQSRWEIQAMPYGHLVSFMKIGWIAAISLPATQFTAYDVYAANTKIIDIATSAYVGAINNTTTTTTNLTATNYLNFHVPNAGDGETLGYVPLEYGATNLLLQSVDLTNGSWVTTNASATTNARVASIAGQQQYTITSSSSGGNIRQQVSIAADTTTYLASWYVDSSSAATLYTLNMNMNNGTGSFSVTYNPSTGNATCTALSTCGVVNGPTLADGSFRRRIWVAKANGGASTTNTVTIYANGSAGAASSIIGASPQLVALDASALVQPSSYIPTAATTASRTAGVINPLFIPSNLGTISTTGTITLGTAASDATHTDATVCRDTTSGLLLAGSGAAGICLGTSSARYKRDILPEMAGLDQVMQLSPVNYRYIKGYGDGGARVLKGFLAEDMAKVMPELVGLDLEGKPQSVDWAGLVPVMVKAIQQLDAKVKKLEAR